VLGIQQRGDLGELGYPRQQTRQHRCKAAGITNATGVTATDEAFTCALLGDGTATVLGDELDTANSATARPGYVCASGPFAGIFNVDRRREHQYRREPHLRCSSPTERSPAGGITADSAQLGDGTTPRNRPVPVSRAIRAGYPPI
jgi:hypothetical protein